MRWSSYPVLVIALSAAFGSNALAQRGLGGSVGHGALAAGPSSTAMGAGASAGRAAFPSSTAIGAGAPTRSSFGRQGVAANGGYYGGSGYSGNSGYYANNGFNGNRSGSRSSANGRRRDYRNVPFPYFLTPYYYPSLDYGSAPYGGAPEDLPYDPSLDSAAVGQNLLGQQVLRLSAEIEQMKNAQQAPQQDAQMPAPVAQPDPAPAVAPVTVVLRNGQKLQVQNYAVMDHTFWDFSKQPARKIPISSIDVSASSMATAAGGGEFPQLESKQ